MANKIRLGELLVRAGVLDEVKLKAALAEQQRWGGRLGKILVDMSFVSEDLLVKALSKQLGIPRASFQNFNVPPSILQQIDPGYAQTHALCPEHYDAEKRTLTIATADPTNVQALDEIRFRTGLRIQTTIAGETLVHDSIMRHLRGMSANNAIDVPDVSLTGMSSGFMPEDGTPGHSDVQVSYGYGGMTSSAQGATQPPALPAAGSEAFYRPSPSAVPQAAPPAMPSGAGAAYELAQRLDAAQKQQQKAIRVMLELLMEKGVISRDDYLRLFSQR